MQKMENSNVKQEVSLVGYTHIANFAQENVKFGKKSWKEILIIVCVLNKATNNYGNSDQ